MTPNCPAATTALGKDEGRRPEFQRPCTGSLLRSYGYLLRFSSPQPGLRQDPQPKRAAGSGGAAAGEPRWSRAARTPRKRRHVPRWRIFSLVLEKETPPSAVVSPSHPSCTTATAGFPGLGNGSAAVDLWCLLMDRRHG
ncbi:unnamed protein product [Coccothraustes coccothraustes]